MSDNNRNIISVKNLSFSYSDKEVLSNVNLDVPPGIVLGIVGPNGGGKTTFLKILLGLLKRYSGEVKVNCQIGVEEHKRHHHRCVGYVPQNIGVNRRFPSTVYDAVEMGLYGFHGFRGPSKEEKEYIDWLLGEVGIREIKDRSISQISGGQLQRTFIARALVTKPSLLFLDEPLVGVDHSGVLKFIELILGLKKKLNLTVIFVSHDLNSVKICSDRIACLNRNLHYHENPEHLTLEQLQQSYSCGFEAYSNLDNALHSTKESSREK
jgi:zinc transport system ATP-binding protein